MAKAKPQQKIAEGAAPAPPEAATFSGIIGQDATIAYIRRAFLRGRLPHALLFDGPSGVGKSAMAFAAAKFLLAGGEEAGEAALRHAGKVERGSHPDLRALRPSGAAGFIRIDDARAAQDWAYQTPVESERKVLLIDPADRLNPSSANSLLKLIEEPPKAMAILMATESIHSILPTIRSRAARLRLRPAPEQTVADWLAARFAAAPNEALAAAMFSGGCPAKAVALLNGQALADRDALADEWRFFQRHGSLALFRTASRMAKIAPSLDALLAAWTIWLRDGLVCATAPERADLLINRDRAADLAAEAGALGAGALGACLEILIEARADTRRMVNPQLMIETLLLRIGPKLKPAAGSAAR